MIYEVLLLIGLLGLIAQTVLGFGHMGGAAGHHGGAASHHGGAAHGHGAANAHGHGHAHAASAASRSSAAGRQASTFLLTLLSPMTIFSLCLGAGAAGLAAQALRERPAIVVLAALAGGIVFYAAIVRPIASVVFRFASKPASTLAGAVATEAVATSRFDSRGRGVVRMSVDGQLVRVLANVEADERNSANLIAPGDRLLVVSIDKKKNACTVTRLS